MDILYRVLKGEKLCEIANKFNTTIEQIVYDNNLTCPIKENQTLYIKRQRGFIITVLPFSNLSDFKIVLSKYKTSYYKVLYPFQKIKILT